MTERTKGLVTYRGAVSASQCDHIGHMNIVSYGAKFDEANWVFFCELGLTPSYLRSERYGMAGVQQNISYKQELFAGDVIEISLAAPRDRRQAPDHAPRDAQHRDRGRRGRCATSPLCTSTSASTRPAISRPQSARQLRSTAGGSR